MVREQIFRVALDYASGGYVFEVMIEDKRFMETLYDVESDSTR